MTVQSEQNTTVHSVPRTMGPANTEPQTNSTIRQIAETIVRMDEKAAASMRPPKSARNFKDYVNWLSDNGHTPPWGVETDSVEVEKPVELANSVATEPAIETASPISLSTFEGVAFPAEIVSIDDWAEVHPSVTISNSVGIAGEEGIDIATDAIDEPARHFRLDGGHASPKKSVRRSPHILVDEAMADLGRTIAPGEMPNFSPVTFPPRSIKSKQANWDVPDFRWPSLIESVSQRQPKLARLLLNQSTRFVRPTLRRLAVVGNGRQQGTSTLAIGIARWAAESGSRVLLVDADLANPNLARELGIDENGNISWLLTVANREPIADSIIQSGRTGVCLLPLKTEGKSQWGSVAILDMLGTLVSAIQDEFDLVVIDAGSANQLMNSLSESALLVDSALLVHNTQHERAPLHQETCQRMGAFGIEKIVVAENFSTTGTSAGV